MICCAAPRSSEFLLLLLDLCLAQFFVWNGRKWFKGCIEIWFWKTLFSFSILVTES
jgi:hypothetical protein